MFRRAFEIRKYARSPCSYGVQLRRIPIFAHHAAVSAHQVLAFPIDTLRTTPCRRKRHIAPREGCTRPAGFIDAGGGRTDAVPNNHKYQIYRPNLALDLLLLTLPVIPPGLGTSRRLKGLARSNRTLGHAWLRERVAAVVVLGGLGS